AARARRAPARHPAPPARCARRARRSRGDLGRAAHAAARPAPCALARRVAAADEHGIRGARGARPAGGTRGRQGRAVARGARAPARALRPQPRRARQQPAPEARPARRRLAVDRDGARPRIPVRASLIAPERDALGRLFWKFLLAFWLALIAASAIVAVLVALHQERVRDETASLAAGPRTELALRSATAALRHGGVEALRDWLAEDARSRGGFGVYAVDRDGRELLGRTV